MMLTLCLFLMADPQKLVYAAGYIPNVQFAPFYVAQSRGYYAEEGIELEMDYTVGPDVTKLAAFNKVQMASADPDAFLHAATRKMPLVHVATLYQGYPIALIAKEDILNAKDLKGKRIGISGAYGSSYLGLKAILAEMKLSLSDVTIVPIGFTQVAALQQGRVDLVVGYLNNEPLRLKQLGVTTYTRTLSESASLPGVGLMTNTKYFKQHPKLVEGFLRATFRGMADVLADPDGCYALVVRDVLKDLSAQPRYDMERTILEATLPLWRSAYVTANGFGQCEPSRWENLAQLMASDQNRDAYLQWSQWVNRNFTWQPAKAEATPK